MQAILGDSTLANRNRTAGSLEKAVKLWIAAAGLVLSLGLAPGALADPCKAIPDRGPLPAYLTSGASFSGQVVYVGDGDSLCVALGPTPDRWVEVRVADFYAPELSSPEGRAAKSVLEGLAIGRRADCRAGRRSYDRIVALCRLGGRSIGDLMRAQGVAEGGRGR